MGRLDQIFRFNECLINGQVFSLIDDINKQISIDSFTVILNDNRMLNLKCDFKK